AGGAVVGPLSIRSTFQTLAAPQRFETQFRDPLYTRVMSSPSIARVLSQIAEITSETLELQQVFDRVATCVRQLIPFDQMGVVRIIDGDRLVLHAITVPNKPTGDCAEPCTLDSWSPRFRPRLGPIERIDDASLELDPSYPRDAALLHFGVRSV